MVNVQIPTYDVLIPNSTYGKKIGSCDHFVGPSTQITQLGRYTAPAEEDVIKSFQRIAQNRNLSKLEKSLSKHIKMIPSGELKKIAEGDKDSIDHLRAHYPSGYQSGRTYIITSNGIVPDEILEKLKAHIKKNGEMAYSSLIDKIGAKEWYFRMRLNDGNALPARNEIDFLLARGVTASDVIVVEGDYEYKDVINHVRLLYDALDSPKKIDAVKDGSDNLLKKNIVYIIRQTGKCLAERAMLSGLCKTIEEIASS
ncbi:hypothetical protein HYV49_00680 [Candidatus Pacearchaeota archaeon]|nr:hypothetical protein [Candidatus Pacearchaeota archaeon]